MWPFRARKDEFQTLPADNTIGPGTKVHGDLKGPGGFRVDGTVEGSIDAEGAVVVGDGGAIEGSVSGRDVVVLGRVRGDVTASGHLEIGPNGRVVGDVTVQSFRMHKGGVFRGTSRMPGGDDVATTTNPFGILVTDNGEGEPRGRTLPPPTGGVAPPPPPLSMGAPTATPEAVASHERLVIPDEDLIEIDEKHTGTAD